MTITEKAAYLKGLLEGMNLDEAKPETKLLKAMIDVIDDMAITVCDLDDSVDTLNAYCDELDEDLGQVEEYVFGDESEGCDFDCDNCEDPCWDDDEEYCDCCDCDCEDDFECDDCGEDGCDCGCDHE